MVKGNFLNRDEIKHNYKYFLLIFVLLIMMIYANHLVSRKIQVISHLKEQSEEYKSRNAYAQSELIHIKLESQLSKEMKKDSLLPLESHPLKIIMKMDNHGAEGK